MTVQERLYTADDLWEISHENPGRRFELYQGELLEMAPAGFIHGILTMWVGRLIGNFVDEHDLGITTGAETGFILFTDPFTVFGADVAFVAKANLLSKTAKYYPQAPDMAVEIVSPNDKASEIETKVEQYLKAGTRLLWVMYPETRTVHVRRPDHDIIVAKEGDTLEGYDVLPGFTVAVTEIFKKLD